MKVIIAPTDFSPASLNAINYAADLAGSIHASLSLLHVCQLPLNYPEVPMAGELLTVQIESAEKKLNQIKEELAGRTPNKIRIYTEVQTGMVLTVLKEHCTALNPYAVVMSTQGAGAVEKFLFGSNTAAAIRHLAWPLIIVPTEAHFTNIKKIGLACDLKNVVETAPVEEVKALVKEFGATLYVIHVNTEEEKEKYGPGIVDQSGLLQEMLQDVHPSYHFLDEMEVEEGLGKFAEKNNLDLLIMAPKKHNLIDKLLHKRHTKEMALHSPVPLMAIHE